MASFGVVEECDGKFLEGQFETNTDETDFARAIIDLVKIANIPPKYFQNRIFSPHSQDMSSFQKVTQSASRYRLLHREWGKTMSRTVEGRGVMALLTIAEPALDEDGAKAMVQHIQKLLNGVRCEFLRWDQQCLLLYFGSAAEYQQLGERFLDGRLDECGGSRVMQLEAAKLTNPPRSLIEISVPSQSGDRTRQVVSSFLAPFSSAFTHASILEAEGTPAGLVPADSIPSMGLVMFFPPQTQSRAQKVQEVLSAPPWRERPLPQELSDYEFGTHLYAHSEIALPFWGIRTGAAASGVRILLLVQDPGKFDVMDVFYREFIGVTALESKSDSSAFRCSTYTLSPQCEFMLAHYPGFKLCQLNSVAISFHIRNLNKAAGAERINDDHWMTHDPEGNRVALFSVRR